MEMQAEAEQRKCALVLEFEGERQSNINFADGRKSSVILESEAAMMGQISLIIMVEFTKKFTILFSHGLHASCSKNMEQRAVMSSEDIKQALVRSAGWLFFINTVLMLINLILAGGKRTILHSGKQNQKQRKLLLIPQQLPPHDLMSSDGRLLKLLQAFIVVRGVVRIFLCAVCAFYSRLIILPI